MRYRVRHVTTYQYAATVSLSLNLVHLQPRATPTQEVLTSEVAVMPPPPDPADPSWESVCDALRFPADGPTLAAAEFRFGSAQCPTGDHLAAFAATSFVPGSGLLAAADHLIHAFWTGFRYDATVTNHTTPVDQVLATRAGVCQDFAHLAIAALRSLGLAARYISGYLENAPAPGETKLRGADASHAWFELYCPGHGWVGCDPTNDCRAGERHVVCAYGRDFADVTPTRGLILGGGDGVIAVAVDVDRLD